MNTHSPHKPKQTRSLYPVVTSFMLLCVSLSINAEWRPVWLEDFEGTVIDSAKWTNDIGNGFWSSGIWIPGWGNNEQEYYTGRPENAYVSGGVLHIVARKESYGGLNYTSARLKTQGLFKQTYGRFEFRAKLPQGQGYWPALWLLPTDQTYGTWAASGEIDVMENKGSQTNRVSGAIHYGGAWPTNTAASQVYSLPQGQSVTDWHIYALEWTTNAIRWSVDGQIYMTQTSWWSAGGAYPAPFDKPFHIIMNLAVGGNFGGNPDATTVFPGEMQVDYVHVYDWSFGYAFTPASTNQSSTPSSGTFAVNVDGGCPWVAEATQTWLHTTSSGIGSGTVSYTVNANPTLTFRTGTITVGGQAFTVTQGPAGFAWHNVLGWIFDAGSGWYHHNGFGWTWFSPGQWIWSGGLQGWLAVTDPNSRCLWSTQFRWLTPSASDPYQADTTAIGPIYCGQYNGSMIPDGFVVSERFGYVWAVGDGTWFWSGKLNSWLGVTANGGIWCVSQNRFL